MKPFHVMAAEGSPSTTFFAACGGKVVDGEPSAAMT
jgi:hypothetical protein